MMKLKTMLFSLAVGSLVSLSAQATEKPNILFFLVDDMGVMDTSVPFLTDQEGVPVTYPLNKLYRTPAMERLADQGLRFSQFYANSVCSPTRVSLMTGQTSARHRTTQYIKPESKNTGGLGPTEWNWLGLDSKSVTLARVLQQNGYRTIHAGKAHLAPMKKEGEDPTKLGFDVNIGGSSIGQPGSYLGSKNFGNGGSRAKRAVKGLEQYHGKEVFLTDVLTTEMKKQIGKSVQEKKPFFAHMSYYAVHAPFTAHPKYIGNYKEKSAKLRSFASMIEGMDQSVGDLLDYLAELGVAENTLVVFLGDNGSDAPLSGPGGYHSSAPLKGKKGQYHEGGMRVPFIAAWAKPSGESAVQQEFPIAPGIVHQEFATIMDIWPTLMEVSGSSTPEGHTIDGHSLWGYFSEQRKGNPQKFLMHFPHSHRSSYYTSYRENNWKLVYFYGSTNKGKKYELYDLEKDPFEKKNLANAEPEALQKMIAAMQRELKLADALYPFNKKDNKELRVE